MFVCVSVTFVNKLYMVYMLLDTCAYVAAASNARPCPGWRGNTNKDVSEETQTQAVLSLQRHSRLWQHCDKQKEGLLLAAHMT